MQHVVWEGERGGEGVHGRIFLGLWNPGVSLRWGLQVEARSWTRCTSIKGWAPNSAPSSTFLTITATPCSERRLPTQNAFINSCIFLYFVEKQSRTCALATVDFCWDQRPRDMEQKERGGFRQTQISILHLRWGRTRLGRCPGLSETRFPPL